MDKHGIQALELLKEESKITDSNPEIDKVKKVFDTKVPDDKYDNVETYMQQYVNQEVISFDDKTLEVQFLGLEGAKEQVYGSLDEVYGAYDQHYHIEDYRKIDLLLATALSNNTPDKNIWLMFVGASGVGKSMMTNPLNHVELEGREIAHMTSDITTNTIVSGQGGRETDLAPDLDGRIMYVPDMSTIVGKRSEDQREIFAQLRNLYDGKAKKETGSHGQNPEYEVDVTFMGNVTPAIFSKQLIHQDMGTRFLYYEINDFNKEEVFDKIWNGTEKSEEDKSKEIAEVIESFLIEARSNEVGEVDQETKEQIETVAEWTANMRASGEFDRMNESLKSTVVPEEPTRILKQFKKVYENLLKLESDYSEERALSIIRKIGASSIDPDKRRIFVELDSTDNALEMSELMDRTDLGRKAIKRRLLEMTNVGVVENDLDFKYDSSQVERQNWKVTEEYQGLSEDFVPK